MLNIVDEGKTGRFMPWKKEYVLGIPLIDKQHKILVGLTDDLYEACREGIVSAEATFREASHTVVDYVKIHFSTEEKIMDKTGYPGATAHKGEHRAFVAKFLNELSEFEKGKAFVYYDFAHFLRDWILNHVSVTDKKMVEYVLHSVGNRVSG